ncbi:hypothetical protein jhhlp_002375 [Lomentospora prolificans]|uniref:Basic proline-rich protein n=1 Tax=Lomentospora prolificans TaxID=41688 RepID=A0A2N3NDU1_9PEZI|nr:hypothetical protein jhhlp_002375 [Lomentospora prolificans]
MEPVPETERMEEFRQSPLPTLRLQNPNVSLSSDNDGFVRLQALRRSTDPTPSSPKSPSWYSSSNTLPYRPRTTSPLSGVSSHTRSRSAASPLALPLSRTQSLPGVNGAGHFLYSPQLQPASPSRSSSSPSRIRIPRKIADEAFPPTSPIRMTVLEPAERKTTERISSPAGLATPPAQITVSRHRRPASPFRHFTTGAVPTTSGSYPGSGQAPFYRSPDSFPGAGYSSMSSFAPSSVPSTPTSTRSRSPSISSLETIPDSPDAEEAALEAERLARLKADAEAAESSDSSTDSKSRSSLEVPPRGRTLGFGSRDKRKRWSVCGAERRGDLDLETIWED